jgi:AraC-like DNA-binding protein
MLNDYKGDLPYRVCIIEHPAVSMHWHTYSQICAVIEGTGTFFFKDKEYSFKPGDIFVIGNLEMHLGVPEVNTVLKMIYLIFDDDIIAPVGSTLFDYEYLYILKSFNNNKIENKIPGDLPVAKKVYNYLFDMKDIFDKKEKYYEHELFAVIRVLLTILHRHFDDAGPVQPTNKKENSYLINQAYMYINEHYLDSITMKDIINYLHISESHFRMLFKTCTGMGFKEYLSRLRISKAKTYLLTTDTSIANIAYNVRFSNLNQFYRMFTKYENILPADYRKQNKFLLEQR